LLKEYEGVLNPCTAVEGFSEDKRDSVIAAINTQFVQSVALIRETNARVSLEVFQTDTMGDGVRNKGDRPIPVGELILLYYGVVRPYAYGGSGAYLFDTAVSGTKITFDAVGYLHLPGVVNMGIVNHKCQESGPNCEVVTINSGKVVGTSGFHRGRRANSRK
jgi:hypothetical protein